MTAASRRDAMTAHRAKASAATARSDPHSATIVHRATIVGPSVHRVDGKIAHRAKASATTARSDPHSVMIVHRDAAMIVLHARTASAHRPTVGMIAHRAPIAGQRVVTIVATAVVRRAAPRPATRAAGRPVPAAVMLAAVTPDRDANRGLAAPATARPRTSRVGVPRTESPGMAVESNGFLA